MVPLCFEWRLLSRGCVLWLPTISPMALRLPRCTKAPGATLAGTVRSCDARTLQSLLWKEWHRPPVATDNVSILKRQSIKTDHVWPRRVYLEAFSYCTFHLASFGTRPYRFPQRAGVVNVVKGGTGV